MHVGGIVLPVQDAACNLIVAIGEDVSFDDNRLTNDALDRKSAAIDLRSNAFDYDSTAPVELVAPHAVAASWFRKDRA